MTALASADAIARVTDESLAANAHLEGPLLPILHAIQSEMGYVPEVALPRIAARLNLSRAEVFGVMSFYHDFRKEPAGKTVLKMCRAEACQSVGGNELAEDVKRALGVDWHGTTADGAVTLEPVYCLGLCACGPAVMVGDKVIGRVDAARLDEIISEARK